MNNLLRTLTESQVKPGSDLKLLLTAVKETRRQCYDSKLSDAFYESLDNLLADLRTITIDNRDPEAFLKPVSRAEVPDYYDYIIQPMDLATMGKKVKNKQYKSKREFKDDLDLIWSNCYKYNAAEDHPLRQCADRLKVKADRLLKHITDRKDRTDPSIPFELVPQVGIARPKVNGIVNGITSHTRTPSLTNGKAHATRKTNLPFNESTAILRTGEGMVAFRDLDRGLAKEDPKSLQKLKALAPDMVEDSSDDAMEGIIGDKRKLNGVLSDGRPRKRTRFASLPDDLSQLWWHAVQTEPLLANGIPEIPYASSSRLPETSKKPKRRKRKEGAGDDNSKSLLSLMNSNIKAMRRVRHTHNKLASVITSISGPEDPDGEGGFGAGPSNLGMTMAPPPVLPDDDLADEKIDERHWLDRVKFREKGGVEIGEEGARDCVNWMGEKVLEHVGFQGTSKGALDVLTSVASDYFLNVGRTLRFMTDKYAKTMSPEEIVLHTLFESGVSKVQELERFISDDIERYGSRLVELEKKLSGVYREVTAGQEALEDEGLFEEEDEEEAGALALGDFADSLGEDYLGLRELGIAEEFGLTNLSIPKALLRRRKLQKLAAAKPAEKPLDYPLPPSFLPFTHSQAEEQIGLLKPYYESRFQQLAASQVPPPPPPSFSGTSLLPGPSISLPPLPGPSLSFLPPLPGPSLSLANANAKPPNTGTDPTTQPYPPIPYPTPASSDGLPGPSISNGAPRSSDPPARLPPSTTTPPAASPSTAGPPAIPPNLALPDDPIPMLQAKMGPIGQIIKPNTGAVAKKKFKATADDAGGSGAGGIAHSTSTGGGGMNITTGATFIPTVVGPNGTITTGPEGGGSTKKKKGNTGVGSGNGRKKKDQTPGTSSLILPISAAPSQASSAGGGVYNQGPGPTGGGRGGGGSFPSVVIASA